MRRWARRNTSTGAAKAVDGLLSVAHGAQRATALARQEVDEVDLLLIGVLELVDHDHREFARIRIADTGVIAQRLIGEAEQVVVIECRALRLERGVLVADGAGKGEQLVESGASESQIGVDEGIGGLCLEQSHLLLGKRLARAGHAAGEHARREVPARLRTASIGLEGIQRDARGLGRLGTRAETLAIGVHEAREIHRTADEVHVAEAVTRGTCALEQGAYQALGARARLKAARVQLTGQRVPLLQLAQAAALPRNHGIDCPVHKRAGDGLVQNAEFGVEAELERMGAQDARAHTVNRRDPRVVDLQGDVAHALLDEGPADALANLGGGVFGERDGQHLVEITDEGAGLGRERP